MQLNTEQLFMDKYHTYYDKIINAVSIDTVYESIRNYNEEEYSLAFTQILQNRLEDFEGSRVHFHYRLKSYVNNDTFKYLVGHYSTLDVLKIMCYCTTNNYRIFNEGFLPDFILDRNLNVICPGDNIIAGYLNIFKVVSLTKSSSVKVQSDINNVNRFKYYPHTEVLKYSVI